MVAFERNWPPKLSTSHQINRVRQQWIASRFWSQKAWTARLEQLASPWCTFWVLFCSPLTQIRAWHLPYRRASCDPLMAVYCQLVGASVAKFSTTSKCCRSSFGFGRLQLSRGLWLGVLSSSWIPHLGSPLLCLMQHWSRRHFHLRLLAATLRA